METEEMVHSSLLSLQAVVSMGVFPTIHLPGIHKGGRSNKRGNFFFTRGTCTTPFLSRTLKIGK